MNQLLISAVIGLLVAAGAFVVGVKAGSNSKGNRHSPEDFKILGEEYELKMRDLSDENRAHIKRWGAMGSLLASLGTVKESAKLAQLITRLLKEEIRADYTAVLYKNEEYFQCAASDGIHVDSEKVLVFQKNDPLINYLLKFPEVVLIKPGTREYRFFSSMNEDFNEIMIMPLKVGGKVQGLLWAAKKPKSLPFSEGDKTVMTYMGNAMGYMSENIDLIEQIQERAFNIVKGLAKALEQKDEYTRGHSDHVSQYSVMFAKQMGVDRHSIETIERAALLHDIGKIGIPDKILNKPGKLTNEEFEVIKSHPLYGAELLKTLGFLKEEQLLILHHHEKFAGGGYPYGIKGPEIPRGAMIIALADVFDALTTDRPYRKAYSVDEAIDIMQKMKGDNFEPSMCDEFLKFVKTRLNVSV